jgi:hypothetical protein
MHRCLQISEIVHNIVKNLPCHRAVPGIRSHGDLLAIATVSKMFSEPALECLWAEQDSLRVLLRTLPRDLWNEGGDGNMLVGLLFLPYQTLNTFLMVHQLEVPTALHPVRFG